MGRIRKFFDRMEGVLERTESLLAEVAPAPPSSADFARHSAFRWEGGTGGGRLVAIAEPVLFDLDDLVGGDDALGALERHTRQLSLIHI